jgi:methionine-gamma-lyase
MFSSGMGAIAAVIMACCKNGGKVLAQKQLYGTTDELMQRMLPAYGIETIQRDVADLNALESTIRQEKNIRLLYLESPSNPLLEIVDITALSALAKQYQIKIAVDNTFSTPYLQQPLALGADFSIHSTTKFLNGHGNALGGMVISADIEFMKIAIWEQVKLFGGNSNAFDAWLLLQGLKTLELRMERHCANAHSIAGFLQNHPAISKVYYPGLKSHPQHALAKKQMRLFGAMLGFELAAGEKAGKDLLRRIQLCKLVTSLGTIDTILQHPATMTHTNVAPERRIALGITDGYVRMSVGIENAADIIQDLEQALS